jgi:hypothetical protein
MERSPAVQFASEKIQNFKNAATQGGATFNELNLLEKEIKRELQKPAYYDPIRGEFTGEGRLLAIFQEDVSDAIQNAATGARGGAQTVAALKDANRLYTKSIKLSRIEDIFDRANRANNPAQALRTGFNTLINNKKAFGRFSPEEQFLIRKAAKSGAFGNLLETFGSRLMPIVTFGASGPVASLATAAGSAASRGLAGQAQMLRAGKVAKEIAKDGKFVRPKLPQRSGGSIELKPDLAPINSVEKTAPIKNTVASQVVASPRNEVAKGPKSSSWVIVNKETGEAVMETFDLKVASKVNTKKYDVIPIYKYLTDLNESIKKR